MGFSWHYRRRIRNLGERAEALALAELGLTKFGPALPQDVYAKFTALSHEDTLRYYREHFRIESDFDGVEPGRTKTFGDGRPGYPGSFGCATIVLDRMELHASFRMKTNSATMSDAYDSALILEAIKLLFAQLQQLWFERILTLDDLRLGKLNGKPAPDIYHLAAISLMHPTHHAVSTNC